MGMSSKGSEPMRNNARSRVSSYREEDDDLEEVGRQLVAELGKQSNMLASDDSILGDNSDDDEGDQDTPATAFTTQHPHEAAMMDEDEEMPPPMPPREPEAPVRTLYIVPKAKVPESDDCSNQQPCVP
ncbi:expressed unknown protein [Seminavis robusta]|uniref:Uncharacterized protein n=1 Tax=Seminavis robusta TaxID=568900 RepID=A0A9N8EDG1_9STRA|nr:expressed unknown protein [Seminavis robusta]|eukprot:Sro989_g228470.1 n/a (128) ;mRNA; f:16040-16423